MNTERQGDADSRRMGKWAVFGGAGGAERGAFGAITALAAPGDVKRGKMAIGLRSMQRVNGAGVRRNETTNEREETG